MKESRQFTVNLLASAFVFIMNIGIQFFLSPYIINSIGVEAYGFVTLGGNFISFASLITIALNSMAGRFISIEIHKNDINTASQYFSSVVIANLMIVTLLIIPIVACIAFLEKMLEIPLYIISDVKVYFSLLFFNFLCGIVTSSFSVSTFVYNRLYLQSLRSIEGNLIQVSVLILLFLLFEPTIYFLGIAASLTILYVSIFNIYYTRKLLPQIRINKSLFVWNKVKELIISGIWNSVIRAGQILLNGLDLLLANIYISATAMGTMAIVKVVPTVITTLLGTLAGLFLPTFTKYYAQNQKKSLIKSTRQSMKMLGFVVSFPIVFLFVYGEKFFLLWVPTENAKELQILSIITILTFLISGPIQSIYNVFTVTNKLKANALALIFTGIINVIIVFVLLEKYSMGLYAIVIVNAVLGVLRNVFFTATYGAKILELKIFTFFKEIIQLLVVVSIMVIVSKGVYYLIPGDTWITLISAILLIVIIGIITNFLFYFNSEEKKNIIDRIRK